LVVVGNVFITPSFFGIAWKGLGTASRSYRLHSSRSENNNSRYHQRYEVIGGFLLLVAFKVRYLWRFKNSIEKQFKK
jgi:hypothetical protein